ncbi:MAG TPA: aminodeoxychorismate/anthranilate synthase component II [Dehalococcoidia bacterium]|jgi:anthranilate synthase/aminodeoxychorismate synthase-like glutamine amidotransferase|nr:aminodeoxychorismate/anthranilate synthase component II [Dehalococcoidia bacterium]
MSTLLIDNYDSFTYNLFQFMSELGADVIVHRNDEISVAQCATLKPTHVVISPGPGHPRESGISRDIIREFAGKIPVLGVCLGHQCVYEVFGGEVNSAGEIKHGKLSEITHDGKGVFAGLPERFKVCRYHSLAGTSDTLPDVLEITSRSGSGIIMGIRHREKTVEGVQFHPESVATEWGHELLANFLKLEGGQWR